MIPVQQFMPDALAAILRKAPLTPEKVDFAWRSAVGGAVARATSVELADGVLRVRAKDAAWQREIERSAAVVRARLDAILGAGVVRWIECGPVTASAAGRSGSSPAAAAPAGRTTRSAGESESATRRR